MSKLVICEKPSVAKSIASALGVTSRADGYFEGGGWLISWCIGHLVGLADAAAYDDRYKKWRYEDLPILPDPFRYVVSEEKELMEQKMAQLQTKRIGAYLRKMAIDGYIIQVDTRDIKEMNKLLSAIGRNINQIAKRVNAGGPTYQADMEEIRERLDQIWQLQRRILLSQR